MRIGIDLGGTKIELIALDDQGQERIRRRVPTPRGGYQATLDAIENLIESTERDLGKSASVGIGAPGAVSPATGLIKNANSTWLLDQPLVEDLSDRLGRPVRLANDADCFALSEAVDGAAVGAGSVFGVIMGTGTGAGIVIRGQLLSGPNAIAGEWGHNPLPWPQDDELPGPDCYCGLRGCLETWLSGPGFAASFYRLSGKNLDAPTIVELARQGGRQAQACLEAYFDRLTRGLAHVINILDPEVIVLGGGMSNIDELYTEVPARWGNYVFSDRIDTRLVRHAHGDSGGVRGAAWLWPPNGRY